MDRHTSMGHSPPNPPKEKEKNKNKNKERDLPKGVSCNKKKNNFMAQFGHKGKVISAGSFSTPDLAFRAVNDKRLELDLAPYEWTGTTSQGVNPLPTPTESAKKRKRKSTSSSTERATSCSAHKPMHTYANSTSFSGNNCEINVSNSKICWLCASFQRTCWFILAFGFQGSQDLLVSKVVRICLCTKSGNFGRHQSDLRS